MFLVIYFLLLITGLVGLGKNYKLDIGTKYLSFSRIYGVLVSVFIIAIAFIKIDCPDYKIYEWAYISMAAGNITIDNTSLGKGFYVLCMLFAKVGLKFRIFRGTMISLHIIVTYIFINRFTKNQMYVYGMYLIMPLIMNVIQFRAGIGLTLVMIVIMLYQNKGIGYKLLCAALILCAATVHTTMLFFGAAIFAIPLMKKIGNIDMYIIFGSIAAIAIKGPLVSIISMFVSDLRFIRYFKSNTIPMLDFGIMTITIFMNLFFLNSLRKAYRKEYAGFNNVISSLGIQVNKISRLCSIDRSLYFFDIGYYVQLLLLLSLPLLSLSADFFRLQRIMWPIIYISIGIFNYDVNHENIKISIDKKGYIWISKYGMALYYFFLSFYYIYYLNIEVFKSLLL